MAWANRSICGDVRTSGCAEAVGPGRRSSAKPIEVSVAFAPYEQRGIFPNVASALRLITMVLIEQTENWQTERGMLEESMQKVLSVTRAG